MKCKIGGLLSILECLLKSSRHQLRAETLLAVIKDLLYLQYELSLFFLIFASVCSTEDVVVKCSPGYIQGFTEFINIVLLMLSVQCFQNIQSFTQWNFIDKAG